MIKPTLDELIAMIEADLGWCVSCGSELDGLEPDAHDVECDVCGARTGYGAQELLIQGLHE